MSEHGPARWGGNSGKKSVQARTGGATAAAPVIAEPLPSVEPDATDAAKAFAAEYSIDLATVTGTGADGRITKDDVAALVPQPEEPAAEEPTADEPTADETS